jgi:uncharacterized membrane protein YoaK (UPF0700 family)
MPAPAKRTDVVAAASHPVDDDMELSRLQNLLPPLLSVIAGMVDLTGFFTLGKLFTAHVTGNLVLAAAASVGGGPLNVAQVLAIPVFMLAVAATWLIAEASHKRGPILVRLLLEVQLALLVAVLIFSIVTRPSADPHGLMAGIAAMIAVSAMACQYATLRLALPKVVSTAVMTGNLTNAVLSLMEASKSRGALDDANADHLRQSLRLLVGFLAGCLVAAVAVCFLDDWAWLLPAALAALAIAIK